ncbi:MAG: hypothetical protein KJ607_09795 [Bacteroidetes bacterium]|nr:hypothetical protein [Bacteroidota bacterium]
MSGKYAEIIEKLRNRDENVYKFVYSHAFKSVRAYITDNSGSEADIRDILHEAFLVLFDRLEDEQFTLSCSVNTYLNSTSRVLWTEVLKKRKQGNEITDEVPEDIADTVYDAETDDALYRLVVNFILKSSLECKKILWLALGGIKTKELTKMMNYSSDQITMNRRYYCIKILIKKIRQSEQFKEITDGIY